MHILYIIKTENQKKHSTGNKNHRFSKSTESVDRLYVYNVCL